MTAAVIGIALTLPAGLHLLLDNLQQLSSGWEGSASISLFLRRDLAPGPLERLRSSLAARPGVATVRLITREQALAEFRRLSGFAGALENLGENPLPPVLVVTATDASPPQAQRLLSELEQLDAVEFAQLDLQWLLRFQAITEIARRAILVLAALLGAAVLLVVVNTIRLEIQNRHREIGITRLVGATDAFIRRPFLYLGFWYGLAGGAIAWLLVLLSLQLLKGPVARLAGLYQSSFTLNGMDLPTTALLIGGGSLLGLTGAWLAVSRHLSGLEPE
ncbi:MAG TPA: ABC transporter permease [Sedimenticola sp.]|nr:ABC transporter permease [Sedimenticola sp.]